MPPAMLHFSSKNLIKFLGYIPVAFCLALIGWSYYAFVVELCLRALLPVHPAQAVLYLIGYHPLLVLFVWSYLAVVWTCPGKGRDAGLGEEEADLEAGTRVVFEVPEPEPEPESEPADNMDDALLGRQAESLDGQADGDLEALEDDARESQQRNPRPMPRLVPLSQSASAAEPNSTSITVKRDGKSVRYCRKCRCAKPDRAHHCRICQEYSDSTYQRVIDHQHRCVLKMDHHCPWINGCVGYHNQKAFYLFIVYGAFYTSYIFACLAPVIYNLFSGDSGVVAEITVHWVFLTVASVIFAPTLIGFSVFHTYLLASNITTIENFQRHRYNAHVQGVKPTENAFDLGWRKNMMQVLGPRPWYWPVPLRTRDTYAGSLTDGVRWEVRLDMSTPYTASPAGQGVADEDDETEAARRVLLRPRLGHDAV